MFVDRIRIFAQAGNGGRGCVSFRREKFVPKGGPDGGDGGKGGDVILWADQHTDHLAGLFYEPVIKAKNGEHGQGKKMHGRNAPNKSVKVPVGTIVYRAAHIVAQTHRRESGEAQHSFGARGGDAAAAIGVGQTLASSVQMGEGIADLTRDGEEFLLCQGGAGGTCTV